ncbi:MAG: hypothetical protein OXI02_02050 [Candidatus Dadabacteria bacterium]|nr:hypothetical protein [Candidatus Dadabacteria bacterium]MDE0476835.1 hypothetical protein [Candidatus Dadabacteria bacterium]
MYREYAVEPAAIGSSWGTFRYLIEKFGFQKGRLISRFPSRWERLVIEAAKMAGVGDIALSRITEKLRKKKEEEIKIVNSGRIYDPSLGSWIASARVAHAVKPFHAIIAQGDHEENEIVTPEELEEDHPLMIASTSCNVPRTSKRLAEALLPLLLSAREVDIVDPFFDLQNSKYTNLLSLLLSSMYNSRKNKEKTLLIRIHFRLDEGDPREQFLLENAHRWVRGWLLEGFELHLYEWKQKPGGEDFHARLLLCDCGGLAVDAGFAAVGQHESTIITLLDYQHVQRLRKNFAVGATVYDKAGNAVRIRSNGETETL